MQTSAADGLGDRAPETSCIPPRGSIAFRRGYDLRAQHRVQELMPVAMPNIVAFVVVVLLSGCAGLSSLSSSAPSQSSASKEGTATVAPAPNAASLPSAPPPPIAAHAGSAGVEPTTGSIAPSTAASATRAPSQTRAPAKSPPSPVAQPATKKSITPDSAAPKAAPLDLASLEQRLKETKAIGVLTKITLKNQVDDLLNQFRAFYQGTRRTDLAALRRSYDLLVLKVLSLLQDGDQALASAIAASREAIWGILSDPAKFATI